jgi:hypothetical protein
MDISQLKLLAGRVRALLQKFSAIVGHSQALDLVAALPGLRNWPEVQAFPDRVTACELDVTSAGRLAFRLKKKFSLELSPTDLLSALAPDTPNARRDVLQVWPGGPPPGVYVTTSTTAINALMERYEEATDGSLVYAERAGNGWDGSIDLGENGLWSRGIERLPSGTLLIIGPIELDQECWEEAAGRVEMACLHALDSNLRVAILVDTPTPQTLCEDMLVLVRSATSDPSDADTALIGLVAEDGELQTRQPFAAAYPRPVLIRASADVGVLPESTREALRRELSTRTSGIVLFGSSEIVDHTAYDQVAAGLALTEHAGAAARIMPRHRSTPAKDWLVPDAIKALPFLPSIAVAYAQGYRRMVIDADCLRAKTSLTPDDVLFLCGTYGHDVSSITLRLLPFGLRREAEVLKRLVAVHGLFEMSGRRGKVVASDLFLRGTLDGPSDADYDYDHVKAFLEENRVVRWQDELTTLLDTGAVTITGIKKAASRQHEVSAFLAQRRSVKKAS